MNYKINRYKERYNFLNEWLIETLDFEDHRDIDLKATLQVYDDEPLLSIFYKIYILPSLFLIYLSKLKSRYFIKKCIKEMELIKSKISHQENLNKKERVNFK